MYYLQMIFLFQHIYQKVVNINKNYLKISLILLVKNINNNLYNSYKIDFIS